MQVDARLEGQVGTQVRDQSGSRDLEVKLPTMQHYIDSLELFLNVRTKSPHFRDTQRYSGS